MAVIPWLSIYLAKLSLLPVVLFMAVIAQGFYVINCAVTNIFSVSYMMPSEMSYGTATDAFISVSFECGLPKILPMSRLKVSVIPASAAHG